MANYTIYGKPGCKPCESAMFLLTREGEEFEYIDISTDPAARTKILSAGFKSVPQVYHGDVHIGGYDDLVAAFK